MTRRALNPIEMLDNRLVKLDRMVQRLRTLIDVLQRDGLDGTPEQGLLRSFELKQQAALAEREKLRELAHSAERPIERPINSAD